MTLPEHANTAHEVTHGQDLEERIYVVPDDPGVQQGLFCEHCYDGHGKRARLQPREVRLDGAMTRYLKCPVCDSTFDE